MAAPCTARSHRHCGSSTGASRAVPSLGRSLAQPPPARARALCAYAGALLLRVSPSRSWCARIHGRTLAGRRAPPSSAPARAAPSSLSLTQPPTHLPHHPATHLHPHHRSPARAELRCSAAAAAAAAAAARAAAISTATGHTVRYDCTPIKRRSALFSMQSKYGTGGTTSRSIARSTA
jgi:hypothetical protein